MIVSAIAISALVGLPCASRGERPPAERILSAFPIGREQWSPRYDAYQYTFRQSPENVPWCGADRAELQWDSNLNMLRYTCVPPSVYGS